MDNALLRNIPLFSALADTDLEELKDCLRKETFNAHQTIFWMDERGNHLYIIESGKVRICYTDEEGKEITLSVLGPGAFFGELSVIDGGPHTATARCLSETQVLSLDRVSFSSFLKKHPQASYMVLEVLASRLRENTARIHNVVNPNKEVEANKNAYQRFIDRVAKSLTSSTFLTIYIVFIGVWIIAQTYLFEKIKKEPVEFLDNPPTFFMLSFLMTLTSFLLNVLILNSQRRQTENDRIRGEIEYQVNLKAQTEVTRLQLKMDKLLEMVNRIETEQKEAEEKSS